MRFERLDLLCFGCFKEKAIDFSSKKSGIHIIYGPNEAGKSTALSAIGDLLFGIPKNSNYNFLHDNKDLRIGAVVHADGNQQPFAFRRRKGNKGTIIDENSSPLPDTLLTNLLQGVDRPFFERMFSLNHERLKKGGKEILDEKDDVGRTLFSASAGLLGLAERLAKLEENADQLWSPRKSAKRDYYQGLEKYDEAERRKRGATLLARNWKEDKDRLEKISNDHSEKNSIYAEKTALQEKLGRIRRSLPCLAQLKKLEEDILKIGGAPRFSENSSEALEAAEKEINQADAALKTLANQINEAQNELETITLDENLLARKEDIKKLEEKRAVVDKHETDIPNRQMEIKDLENKRNNLVVELGWARSKIEEENFFPPNLSARIKELIKCKEPLEARLESSNNTYNDAETRCETLQQEIDGLGKVMEAGPLAAVIQTIRNKGDLQTELKRTQGELSRLNREIDNGLNSLQPWTGSVEELTNLTFPQTATIQGHDKEFEALKGRKEETIAEEERLQGELNDRELEKAQLLRDKQAVSLEQLEEARKHRDKGWDIIRRKYIDNDLVSDEEMSRFKDNMPTITEAYEKSLKSADVLADNRFFHAEKTAQLSENSNVLERLNLKLETARNTREQLRGQEEELEKQWKAEWKEFGFAPLSPQKMMSWLERKDALQKDHEQKLLYVNKEKSLKEEIENSRNQLIQSIEQAGQKLDQRDQPLGFLLELAGGIKSDLDKKSARLEELKRQALAAKEKKDKAKDGCDKAQREKKDWMDKWKEALKKAEFSTDSSKEVDSFLSSIEKIKSYIEKIDEIRITRIEAMKRDIENFHEDVAALLKGLGVSQASANNQEAVRSLARRLEEERDKKSKKEKQLSQLGALREREAREKENREKALAKLQPLLSIAETEDLSVLRDKIEDYNQLQKLEKSKKEKLDELISQGDGKGREELEKECENQDADQVKASLAGLKNEIEELNKDLQGLSEKKRQAEMNLEKISGKADAASAEADKQLALTDMGMAAEGYVRAKTAAILLRWGMEKFRKEKQGPLLERASAIFKVLTLEAFLRLKVDLDDNDKPYLAGVRANNESVGVEGMSDGTVDQLFLALRLASIEECVQKSQPLPFIADDLFINFDDNRAVAGFTALSELSQKTQILFFTHHKHLINVAERALSADRFVVHNL